jgi:hypothetical protein
MDPVCKCVDESAELKDYKCQCKDELNLIGDKCAVSNHGVSRRGVGVYVSEVTSSHTVPSRGPITPSIPALDTHKCLCLSW